MTKLAPGLQSQRTACRDLLGAAEAADRCRGGSLGPVELALGGHVRDHRGLDRAGADRVDADAAGRVLQGGAGGQPDHPVLGGVVGGPPGSPTRPPREEQLTIAPLPWARIWPSSCFMHAHTPRRLIALTRSKTSAGSSAASLGGTWMPALLNAMSSRPKVSTVGLHHGGDAVLVGDVAPNAEDPVAGGGQVVGGRAQRGLVDVGEDDCRAGLGERRAVARPMPELPPVTSATWPVKS